MKWRRWAKSAKKLWRKLANRLMGGRRILVLGDSHSAVFEYCFDQSLLTPHWLNCEIVGGATAYGLNNDHSSTGGWQKFCAGLTRYPSFDTVMIVLGECDCSYALWKLAERADLPPERLLDRSLAGIRRLVGKVRENPKVGKVVLVGAFLPTIQDHLADKQENELRREIRATQAERTRLVLTYNAGLCALALELAVDYFDISEPLLDPQTGLICPQYIDRPLDHHLSQAATSRFFVAALREVL